MLSCGAMVWSLQYSKVVFMKFLSLVAFLFVSQSAFASPKIDNKLCADVLTRIHQNNRAAFVEEDLLLQEVRKEMEAAGVAFTEIDSRTFSTLYRLRELKGLNLLERATAAELEELGIIEAEAIDIFLRGFSVGFSKEKQKEQLEFVGKIYHRLQRSLPTEIRANNTGDIVEIAKTLGVKVATLLPNIQVWSNVHQNSVELIKLALLTRYIDSTDEFIKNTAQFQTRWARFKRRFRKDPFFQHVGEPEPEFAPPVLEKNKLTIENIFDGNNLITDYFSIFNRYYAVTASKNLNRDEVNNWILNNIKYFSYVDLSNINSSRQSYNWSYFPEEVLKPLKERLDKFQGYYNAHSEMQKDIKNLNNLLLAEQQSLQNLNKDKISERAFLEAKTHFFADIANMKDGVQVFWNGRYLQQISRSVMNHVESQIKDFFKKYGRLLTDIHAYEILKEIASLLIKTFSKAEFTQDYQNNSSVNKRDFVSNIAAIVQAQCLNYSISAEKVEELKKDLFTAIKAADTGIENTDIIFQIEKIKSLPNSPEEIKEKTESNIKRIQTEISEKTQTGKDLLMKAVQELSVVEDTAQVTPEIGSEDDQEIIEVSASSASTDLQSRSSTSNQ